MAGRDPRAPLLLAALVAAFPASAQPTRTTVAGLPPAATAGKGAAVPFLTYEAEDGETSGSVLGPDRTFGSLAAEASGRRAVRLDRPGQEVSFVLASPADGLTLRYAIPDSPDGRGLDASLGVYANGRRLTSLPLTSRYGWFYGSYPFTNNPADGRAHHFYDHARVKLAQRLPAGTRLSLRRNAADGVAWVVIDLADLELVPPPGSAPSNALSVAGFGADPSGVASSARAFQAAIARGRRTGRPVWIPPGTYRVDGHLTVDRVTLAGAGHWHSVVRGRGVGFYGRKAPRGSRNVVLRDFAIIGEVTERKDKEPLAAIGGALNNSHIADLWLQHQKVGLWLDGPMDRLTVSRLRILDQAADGLNFHGGVTNSVVEHGFVRNSGDDGLAMWSHRNVNSGNVFRRNTVIAPVLANGIAIYGGRDIRVEDNLVADNLREGGGLHLGARFDATPVQGRFLFRGNSVVRGGVFDTNWRFGVGAFWVYALDRPITGAEVLVQDTELIDSSYPAVHFIGKHPITGITFDDIAIRGAGTAAFQLQSPGRASIRRVVASGLGGPGVIEDGSGFRLIDAGGNRGLDGPAPLVIPPPPSR